MSKRSLLILLLCAAIAGAGYYLFASGANIPGLGGLRGLIAVKPAAQTKAPAPRPQPPPQVGVLTIKPHEVELPFEYAGRVEAYRNVEIRAQVGGLLKSRDFEEGSKVEKDQVLFHIDPATYEVALKRAQAQLAQAQANLQLAQQNYDRISSLAKRDVASKQQHDQAVAQRDQAQASVDLANAEIQAAQINIAYTTINAPVTGISALQSPPVGSLILAQQTLLTTIQQIDPAYVTFSFTDAEGRAFRELNRRRKMPIKESDLIIELRFGDGSVYPRTGKIDIAARRVDVQTGTIEARAIMPNPNDELLPGQFVRVYVRGVTVPDGIVIPPRAISQGPQGPSVFVVSANNVAEQRLVRTGRTLPSGLLIDEGLKAGDRIVVDGVIRVRSGAAVNPVPASTTQGTGQASQAEPASPGEAEAEETAPPIPSRAPR
jgi:membrane fusion protein (multidrug efflux system)